VSEPRKLGIRGPIDTLTLEALDLPAAGSDARGGASSPDADAQKEEALRALQAAAQAERQRLDAVTAAARRWSVFERRFVRSRGAPATGPCPAV